MGCRKYIVGATAVALLIWGPLDHSWPAWLAIRIGYIVALPVATWFLLGWLWGVWKPDAASEARLGRALACLTGTVLVVLATIEVMADTHLGNTQWVRTRDGMEAVGDDIVLHGPDWGVVIMLFVAAGFAFWFSITHQSGD
jgi:hypothetical protein